MAMISRLLQAGLIAAGLMNLQVAVLLLETAAMDGAANLALKFTEMHAYGYDLGLIFFAVNCLLTAVFICQSGFIPRVLGLGIGLSGLVYLTGSILRFVAPDLHGIVAPAYVLPLLAETAFCFWLLFTTQSRSLVSP